MTPFFLGIEIGGTKLQLAVGQARGAIAERRRYPVNPHQGGAGIRRQIELGLGDLLASFKPSAIAVGFGGPVDSRNGRIACSHQVEGWADFPLRDWLSRLAGLPAVVDNDANIAALGEAVRGAGIGCSPVSYVTLGSGVGGGLVVNRQIYHGATPGEAEIGHLRLDRHGTTVESRCSGWAVDARIRRLKQSHPDSLLVQLAAEAARGEARFLAPALQAKDPEAERILRETADDLAFALSHVVHLFHPQVIVLGGGLSLLGQPLAAAVAESLPRMVMTAFHPVPEIRLAALGEDAVPVGCLIAAGQAAAAPGAG